MVELRQTPSKELWNRMNNVANFRAARSEIAAELSKGLDHEFPPADYKVPEGYDFYGPVGRESSKSKTSRPKRSASTRVRRP